MVRRLQRLLRNLFCKREFEQSLDAELNACLDIVADEKTAQGMDMAAALRQARLELGGIEQAKERVREVHMGSALQSIWQDVRYAVRVLLKHRGFTAVAVLSLAFGIGTTTAVYSTVDWLLNRSPGGVSEPDRLVTMKTTDHKHPELGELNFSYPQFEDIRKAQDGFIEVAAYGKLPGILSDDERADQVILEYVTGNYFPMLGLHPAVGRLIAAQDDVDGAPTVAMLSYRFWQTHFGGDPRVVQTSIRLNGRAFQIIGIAPKEFEGYNLDWNGPTDVWVAMHTSKGRITSNGTFLPIIGRLRPGLTIELVRERAQAWVSQMRPGSEAVYRATTIVVRPSSQMRVGRREEAKSYLDVLLGVCALILLAACFNMANFLLGRAASRKTEMALRIALGATRARLVQQLFIEALLIGFSAAALGLMISIGLAHLLSLLPRIYLNAPPSTAMLSTLGSIDARMAGVAIILGIASSLLFGLLPALLASFLNPTRDLKNPRPKWTWGGVRVTPRQVFLVLQVGLSVALSVTAGLYARSFAKAVAVESEYSHPESVLIARIVPSGMSAEESNSFYKALLSRINTTPEVVSAGIGWNPPFFIGRNFFSVPGHEDAPVQAASTAASPRFFETEGIRILAGREFKDTPDDQANGLIINQVLAAKLWPQENPIDQPILVNKERRIVTGVVAEDHCNDLLAAAGPCSWQPFPMNGPGYLRIRTRSGPMAFVPALRRMVRELHPDAAVTEPAALDSFITSLTGAQRTAALASTGLAVLGIVLLALGCVSLFVSMVRDSVKEIAIRMALGASSKRLTWRIVAQGLLLTAAGVAVGIMLSVAIAMQVADQLYQVEPFDITIFASAPLLVVLIGLLSVYWPARFAAKIDPAQSLRGE